MGGIAPKKSIFIGEMNKRWKKKGSWELEKEFSSFFATNQMRFCTV